MCAKSHKNVPSETKIKVLQCIRQGQIGGGESHLLSLVGNLDRDLYEPMVLSFTSGPMITRLEKMGIPAKVIHTERPFDIGKWRQIKAWLKKEKFQLIHAHGTRANSNILWAARSLKIPVVYTIHGWSFHDDQNKVVKKIRILGEKYLTARSTINISVSQTNKETGVKNFNRFRSVVVNNGIDPEIFNPAKRFKNVRAELNIPEDAVVHLFLARFTHQKQPLALLHSFLQVAEQHPKMFLLMVGDGELKEQAIEIVKNSNLQDKILLLPFRQDVPDVLHAADVFVLPSLWEGLPIALLEAMSMAKAIIATKADGTREIIRHLENGYLVDTNNLQKNLSAALTAVYTGKQLREKIQAAARQTVKDDFNVVEMTKQIEDIYQQVVVH